MGYHSDMEAVIEDSRYDDYDADNEATVSTCAVHKGDKVMIQSQISGKYSRVPCVCFNGNDNDSDNDNNNNNNNDADHNYHNDHTDYSGDNDNDNDYDDN